MKLVSNRRLFWFLKPGMTLDLREPATLDMVTQQVLSRGHTADVRALLQTVNKKHFRQSFNRIKNFLPTEVRNFWEHYLENPHTASKSHS